MSSSPPQRWFPREGDLVAIPAVKLRKVTDPAGAKCSYGLVLSESQDRDFPGVWWRIFCGGIVTELHIQVIRPLWDVEGRWLQKTK